MKFLKLSELPNFFRQWYQVIVSKAQLRVIIKKSEQFLVSLKQPKTELYSILPPPASEHSILSIYLQVSADEQETVPGLVAYSWKHTPLLLKLTRFYSYKHCKSELIFQEFR